ncbi:DUF6778 family protein [Tropicimonas sp. S265A]|uniref:DUF6778 family protein n=1 Tax=Tropicimonas sp. S265A TaxID=3415134 RepID=UPI003C7B6803
MSVRSVIAAAILTLLVGCASWQTAYDAPVSSDVSKNWRLNSVSVDVPLTLSVGEANVYAPSTDIVWQEELLPTGTTRHAQVDAIMTDAVRRGASALPGSRPVDIQVVVSRFHALSDYARVRLSQEGVHNINFTLQVTDAGTGAVLVPATPIQSDLVAFTGQDSIDALAAGQTQKVRITQHVAETVAGFLGVGPDNRAEFTRLGR